MTILKFVHLLFGALGIAALLAYAVFGRASTELLDPDGDFANPVMFYLFAGSAKRRDFVGRGWLYRKLQILSALIGVAAGAAWALTR